MKEGVRKYNDESFVIETGRLPENKLSEILSAILLLRSVSNDRIGWIDSYLVNQISRAREITW